MRYRIVAVLVLALSLMAPTSAQAFMTWNTPGNAEHEMITRYALACNSPISRTDLGIYTWRDSLCLGTDVSQPANFERPMRMIAGANGYFGGVGAPDRFAESIISSSDGSHCDNGDYWFEKNPTWLKLMGYEYPRTLANRNFALLDCLTRMNIYVDTAVQQANLMLNADGTVNPAQTDLSRDCNVDYDPVLAPNEKHETGTAKCNTLIAFGRALHIVEDFFSHSNWVDQQPTSPTAYLPPGLQHGISELPDVLRYPRTYEQIDTWLEQNDVITGAYPTPSLPNGLRVYHNVYLNKDEGISKIDWQRGIIPAGDKGHSFRAAAGVINGEDNFQRAVRSAAAATTLMWEDFFSAIKKTYGNSRGGEIWNALRKNTPWTTCTLDGHNINAVGAPTGGTKAFISVAITVVNNTQLMLPCGHQYLEDGQWSSLPDDYLYAGQSTSTLMLSDGGGVQGELNFGTSLSIDFKDQALQANAFSCKTGTGLTCSIQGGKGYNTSITVTLSANKTKSASRGTPTSVTKVIPKRAPQGVGRGDVHLGTNSKAQQFHTMASLNPEASKLNQRQLHVELAHMKKCSGSATQYDLNTDDISCEKAMKLLEDHHKGLDYEKFCPKGWKVIYDPKGIDAPQGAVLCHQDQGQSTRPDERARAFWYVLPHALGNMG